MNISGISSFPMSCVHSNPTQFTSLLRLHFIFSLCRPYFSLISPVRHACPSAYRNKQIAILHVIQSLPKFVTLLPCHPETPPTLIRLTFHHSNFVTGPLHTKLVIILVIIIITCTSLTPSPLSSLTPFPILSPKWINSFFSLSSSVFTERRPPRSQWWTSATAPCGPACSPMPAATRWAPRASSLLPARHGHWKRPRGGPAASGPGPAAHSTALAKVIARRAIAGPIRSSAMVPARTHRQP